MSDYIDREIRQQALNYATLMLGDSTTSVELFLKAAKEIEEYIINGRDTKTSKTELLEE